MLARRALAVLVALSFCLAPLWLWGVPLRWHFLKLILKPFQAPTQLGQQWLWAGIRQGLQLAEKASQLRAQLVPPRLGVGNGGVGRRQVPQTILNVL